MTTSGLTTFPYKSTLDRPVIGLESEFTLVIDGRDVAPEDIWKAPADFIGQPLLKRSTRASQLPTGGAVYFDKGVIEVVTPGIEIAPNCTARAVRNLWEHIAFVRDHLTEWEKREGRETHLRAFSTHYNVSFELPSDERGKNRTIQKLAVLLAHLLPMPLILLGANRLSTGVGVRPRRNRIEVTLDFTPDPGLMIATTSLIVGIVREVMSWPSYLLSEVEKLELPLLAGVEPGKHSTRKGWLTRSGHFPHDPFTSDPNATIWETRDGRTMSLREIALRIAMTFRESIRIHSDPFSFRLLFAVLRGELPSLLELPERPASYDDVGSVVRWGSIIPELRPFEDALFEDGDSTARRSSDIRGDVSPPWNGVDVERRLHSDEREEERRARERRQADTAAPLPLSRSPYETVFQALGQQQILHLGGQTLIPIAMKGWYHALFRRESDGGEELLSIDQLLDSKR